MPTFRITESAPAAYYWYYEIEAATEEEAVTKILNGEVQAYDTKYEVDADETTIVESYEVPE